LYNEIEEATQKWQKEWEICKKAFCHTTVEHETCQKTTNNTQTKQTTQYITQTQHNTNKQMSILQSPKSNSVHKVIIKQ